ncbi:MAG: NUDIX domain-containing protein, partial [Candidatus Aenigmarchaeota archaeon]|nr:NUDIX domain-containing protein [Candidatus Aenigmarchaeota archaeon]
PKGHIEKNESELEAAKREIFEESGITDLIYAKQLGSYERYKIGPGGKGEDKSEIKKIVIFLFKTKQNDLKPVDSHNPEARWIRKEDVAKLLTHKKDKEFFMQIVSQI